MKNKPSLFGLDLMKNKLRDVMRKKMETLDEETHKVLSALMANMDKHFAKKTRKGQEKEGKKDEDTLKTRKGKGKGIPIQDEAALPKGSENPLDGKLLNMLPHSS
ncbi:hypothetical protein U1Q18_030251 [Sarracenia purpurea var. burkii]